MAVEKFEIVIQGTLSPSIIAAVEGFSVRCVEHDKTHLIGTVPDQAGLLGILELLRDLTVTIESVNPVADIDI
jgi:hypothetical protein